MQSSEEPTVSRQGPAFSLSGPVKLLLALDLALSLAVMLGPSQLAGFILFDSSFGNWPLGIYTLVSAGFVFPGIMDLLFGLFCAVFFAQRIKNDLRTAAFWLFMTVSVAAVGLLLALCQFKLRMPLGPAQVWAMIGALWHLARVESWQFFGAGTVKARTMITVLAVISLVPPLLSGATFFLLLVAAFAFVAGYCLIRLLEWHDRVQAKPSTSGGGSGKSSFIEF